jgi:hypothetical protein
MGFLILAMAAAEIAVAAPRPPPAEPALHMSLETVEVGDGAAMVQAGAGYAAGTGSVLLSARWRRAAVRWLPDTAEVSLAAGRELSARTRLDVEVWQGLSRFSGGSGVAVTWSRALR